jgi:hypothetical protein
MTLLCVQDGGGCSAKANHCAMSNQTSLICSTAAVTGTPHPPGDSQASLQTLNEGNAVKNSNKMSAQAACFGTMAANYNSPLLTIAIQLSAIIEASLCALRNKAVHFCGASNRVRNKLGPDRTTALSVFLRDSLFIPLLNY